MELTNFEDVVVIVRIDCLAVTCRLERTKWSDRQEFDWLVNWQDGVPITFYGHFYTTAVLRNS